MNQATLVFDDAPATDRVLSRRGMLACALALAAVYAADVYTPLGVSVALLYVPILWAVLPWATRRQAVAVAIASTLLTVLAPQFEPEGDLRTDIINRSIVLIALWFLAYFGLAYRRMVDALKAHESELADFIENAAIGMHWLDPDGTIAWANSEQLAMLGYAREEFVGHHVAEFYTDKSSFDEILARWESQVALKDFPARLRCRDGAARDTVISSTLQRKSGAIVQIRCFTRDVTDRRRADHAEQKRDELGAMNARLQAEIEARKRALAELRDREDLLRVTFDQAPSGIALIDPDGRFREINLAYRRLLGRTAEELDRTTALELTHEDDRPANLALRDDLRAGRRDSYELEKRYRMKDGGFIWVRSKVSAVRDDGGKLKFTVGITHDITEQRRMEQMLHDREKLYRHLFEVNPMPMWITSTDTMEVLLVNEAAVRLYGYSRDEFAEMTAYDFQPADRMAAYEEFVARRRDGEGTSYRRAKHRRKDGTIIDVDVTSHPVSGGGALRRLVIGQDITGMLRAEEERDRAFCAKAELAAIVETATVGIFTRTLDGVILSWNPGAEKMLGYSSAEAIGAHINFCLPPGRPIHLERNNAVVLSGEVVVHESDRVTKDGRLIQVLSSHSPLYDGAGNIYGASVILQDITALKRAQAKVRESEEQFFRMFRASPVATSIANLPGGQFIDVNDAFVEYLGYRREELIGRTGPEVGMWVDLERRSELLAKLLAGEAVKNVEVQCRRKSGEIATSLYSRVRLQLGDQPVSLTMRVDITDRKRAEEALCESEARYRTLVENSPYCIHELDLQGRITRMNHAGLKMMGVEGESRIQGLDYLKAVAAEDQTRIGKLLERAIQGEPSEFDFATTEGRSFQSSFVPIRDEHGAMQRLMGLTQDITERKRVEQQLRRKTALAQLLETVARVANEATTLREAMRLCLAHICEHGGWVLGRLGLFAPGERGLVPCHSVWHEKHPGRFADLMSASLDQRNLSHQGQFITTVIRENKSVWLDDMQRRSATGRLGIAAACGLRSGFAFPVSVHGEVVAFLEFFGDEPRPEDDLLMEASTSVGAMLARLIERRHAVEERERLAAIVESSSQAIWSRSADDALLTWNAAAERLFGWKRSEVIGQCGNLLVPPDRLHERELIPRRLAGGEDSVAYETVRVRRDGTRVNVEMRASVVRDDAGNIIWTAFIAHDITERKRAEEERRSAETALREYSSRLQVLSRKVLEAQESERASIARELHDQLGQTLSAAKLNLQVFQRRHKAASITGTLKDTIEAVDHALQQVRALALDLRPPQLDDLGLGTTLRSHAERLAKAARLRLHFSADKELPELSPDTDIACFRVAQGALTNVIRHARANNVWVDLVIEGGTLRLRVRDDGRGCELARAKRQALRGRSMGLLSMEERTRLAGGCFTITSEPGLGTEVQAEFPILVASTPIQQWSAPVD